MLDDNPFHDRLSLDDLSGKAQTRVLEGRRELVRVVADAEPRVRAARDSAIRAIRRIATLRRAADLAQNDYLVFESSVGPNATATGRLTASVIVVVLIFSALVEAYLGFPGVRYGLGDLGQINYPWQDPLAFVSALSIGAASMLSAKFAGVNLAWSEKSAMSDLEAASVHIPNGQPSALVEDGRSLDELLGRSTVSGLFADGAALQHNPLADIPVSDEVGAEALRVAEDRRVAEQERLTSLLQTPRQQARHRALALGLIALALGLWTVNGVLRAGYLARLPKPVDASTGILGHIATAPSSGLSPTLTGILIVLLSWLFYLVAVGIVYAMHTPAQLRGDQLRARMRDSDEALAKAIATLVPDIRKYERERGELDAAIVVGQHAEAAARLARDDLDFGALGIE